MIWKNEYKLGNELIDSQHEELFSRVSALVDIVLGPDAASRKQECINAILFLKDYAVKHFAAEEEFQDSLQYKYAEFHKAIHSSFVDSVLEAEKNLVATDFSLPAIKEFSGFLSMWLIYHVAGADQKIVKDEVITVAELAIAVSHQDCVLESMRDVLDTIFGNSVGVEKADVNSGFSGDVMIEIDYDEDRIMRLLLPKTTALMLVKVITNVELDDIDELAYAVLLQFAKTISGNAASSMSKRQRDLSDIKISSSSIIDNNEFYINTNFGRISVSLVKKD